MPIDFVDRVPTRPGRVKITPESGGSAYYATVERADAPTQEGTPLSAANLNAAQDPYVWRTETEVSSYKEIYLSPTGSDANDGLYSTPMLTIKAALRKFAKSYKYIVIRLKDGAYTEDIGELAADLCHVYIRSDSSNKDKVTLTISDGIDSYLPSLRLENITLTAEGDYPYPLSVYAGKVWARGVRFNVPATGSTQCVKVLGDCRAYLYECILNGGTAEAVYCEYGYVKAVGCTSERQLVKGFSAARWGRIEYTPTLTATTMTETKTNGVCALAKAFAGTQAGAIGAGSSGQYFTFDGLLIQWGRVTISATDSNTLVTTTVQYPRAYSNTPAIFVSLGQTDRASAYSVGATTTLSEATISVNRTDGEYYTNVYWIAIGVRSYE